jgi:tetratricopeptide (TPR) repeat protein
MQDPALGTFPLPTQAQGQDLAEQGCWDKALAAWDQALAACAHQPVHVAAELCELRAQVLLEMGRDYEAIQAAQRGATLAHDFAPAHLTLARAQLNLGEPQLAVASFQRVLELQPEHAEARTELAGAQMLALKQQAAGGGVRMCAQAPKSPQ